MALTRFPQAEEPPGRTSCVLKTDLDGDGHWAWDPGSLQVPFRTPSLPPVLSDRKSQAFIQTPEATGHLSIWSWMMWSSDSLVSGLGKRDHKTPAWEGNRSFSWRVTSSAGLQPTVLHADELWRRCLPWTVSLSVVIIFLQRERQLRGTCWLASFCSLMTTVDLAWFPILRNHWWEERQPLAGGPSWPSAKLLLLSLPAFLSFRGRGLGGGAGGRDVLAKTER